MANWTQQITEAYRALQEAELLKGRAAVLRQAQLGKNKKTLAQAEQLGSTTSSQIPGINSAVRIEDPKQIPPILHIDAKQVAREKLRWSGARGGGKAQYGAVKDPYDVDNMGFADAQIRPKSTRKQNDEDMRTDASHFGSSLSLRPNPRFVNPITSASSVKIKRNDKQFRLHTKS
jgi:hypothetical protein